MKYHGNLSKMATTLDRPVKYDLQLEEGSVAISDLLGHKVKFNFSGTINCVVCGKVTKKSFGEGLCYPCFVAAPENSECVLRPELCQGHLGIGRDPEWERAKHDQPHTVYLAMTSGIKVGVTRNVNVPTRWIDQGAWQVIRLAEVPYRQLAGEIEVFLKDFVSDKTNWQRMLKDEQLQDVDLLAEKNNLLNELPEALGQYYSENDEILEIKYPVIEYPKKVASLNFDKTPEITGVLNGIRGQYLMFEGGNVINLRRFSGYQIELEF